MLRIDTLRRYCLSLAMGSVVAVVSGSSGAASDYLCWRDGPYVRCRARPQQAIALPQSAFGWANAYQHGFALGAMAGAGQPNYALLKVQLKNSTMLAMANVFVERCHRTPRVAPVLNRSIAQYGLHHHDYAGKQHRMRVGFEQERQAKGHRKACHEFDRLLVSEMRRPY